jgi:hypothetical protein
MKRTMLLPACMMLLSWFALPDHVSAQGTTFTYQGRLTDSGGPANGTYDLRFGIFDALSGGNQVGAFLTNRPVTVNNGLFNIYLDFGPGVFTGPARWLELGVRTNGSSDPYTPLIRDPITAVPYAITADNVTDPNIARLNVPNTATQATGYPAVTSGFITGATVTSGGSGYVTPPAVTVNDSTGSGAVITAAVSDGAVVSLTVMNAGSGYSSGATLTIGLPPSNANQTFSSTNFFTSANAFSGAVSFNPASGPPFSVASATKVTNLNADLLDGLDSTAFATNGHNHFGESWAGYWYSGAGLTINNTNPGEYAIGFYASTPTSGAGFGIVGSGGLYGVSGAAPSGFAGVRGGSSTGNGVEGVSTSGIGVRGSSTSGTGVYGAASTYGVPGVEGYGDYGVSGVTPNNIGVYANNTGSGTVAYLATAGVAADLHGDTWVNGDLHVTGNKYFTIDHPLDPANKYLHHACVESPDSKNIYDGVIVLDGEGKATVTLPAWFGALNRDFRYQLTALGAPAPNLHVSEKISGNHFKIAGGTAGMEVSWQVTGIRQDAWANAHRIPVEENKPAQERGSYLAPEEHGQSKDKSVQWARHPEAKQLLKQEQLRKPAVEQTGGAK